MQRPANKNRLLPFAESPELTALDDESAFAPQLPRRTALNRIREAD